MARNAASASGWDKEELGRAGSEVSLSELNSGKHDCPLWRTVWTWVCGCQLYAEKYPGRSIVSADSPDFARTRWESLHQQAAEAKDDRRDNARESQLATAKQQITTLTQRCAQLEKELESQAAKIEELEVRLAQAREDSADVATVDELKRQHAQALIMYGETAWKLREVQAELSRVISDRDYLRGQLHLPPVTPPGGSEAPRSWREPSTPASNESASASDGSSSLEALRCEVGAALAIFEAARAQWEAAADRIQHANEALAVFLDVQPVQHVLAVTDEARQRLADGLDLTRTAETLTEQFRADLYSQTRTATDDLTSGAIHLGEAFTRVRDARTTLLALAYTTNELATQALAEGEGVQNILGDARHRTALLATLLQDYKASI
ncbi:hypothetical protein KRMM14A1259_71780 [Krasilnikovia sp. MM14-A1259]